MTCQTSCTCDTCDCYQRGLAEARRTVEAEFAAERAVLTLLAASLTAADDVPLRVNPLDIAYFDDVDTAAVLPDPALPRGVVRLGNDTGTISLAA